MILINIDRNSGIPIFKQIFKRICSLVDENVLKPGYKMPSTRMLAESLNVNRSTVYKAYEELWAHGYLESRPGSYSRVRRRKRQTAKRSEPVKGILDWERLTSLPGRSLVSIHQQIAGSYKKPEQSEIIDMAMFSPDKRLFPVHDFRRCINTVMVEQKGDILEYGNPQGYFPLRKTISQRLRVHGISCLPEEVLITSGSQNGIDLLFKLLLNPGSKVVVESPTYLTILPLLHFYQADIHEVPMDDQGLRMDILQRELEVHKPVCVYCMPNFHNPTGITLSQPRREELLVLCEKYRTLLIEDAFEEEMKFYGRVALPVKSMDNANIVVYLGSFSKVLFPGIRIGWIAGDRDCIRRLTAIKRYSELTTNLLTQAALAEFCRQGLYDLHVKRIHRVYRKRMQTALRALKEFIPPGYIHWTEPAGGYLIWLEIRETPISESELYDLFLKHGVLASPGRFYFSVPPKKACFRISISSLDEEEIEEGIQRLGKALREIYN